MIDIHSHILPGVDDGASTLEDSVRIARCLMEAGVTEVIATPHYVDESIYTATREQNLALLEELRHELAEQGVGLKVYLGNEIYINNHIAELVQDGVIATMAGSDYVLVELPLDTEYPNYVDVLGELMEAGYRVILAHPERYVVMQQDDEVVKELYDMGVLYQCNISSITGKYGKRAVKLVKKLAKQKMIFAFGSDIHHAGQSDFIAVARRKLAKYYSDEELHELMEISPGKIIGK